jgi:ubiquitin carboxyl-terminal hydrolase 8
MPAPVRSNSSFSSLQFSQYSSDRSHFPTNFAFDEGVVGLSGLKNLGNTCYMNSTIQCLSAAIPFAKYFKSKSSLPPLLPLLCTDPPPLTDGHYRKDINTVNPLGTKGHLANAVAELIRMLWAQQYVFLSPVTFREQICRVASQFRGSEQHDAQEFLGFLLDGLHEDCNYVVKKPPPVEMTPEREHDLETLPQQVMSEREWQIYKMRNDSFIVQCFQGQFRNQLKCLTCGKVRLPFSSLVSSSLIAFPLFADLNDLQHLHAPLRPYPRRSRYEQGQPSRLP